MPTVLVTGASRGIGLAFARRYREAGWEVIAACRAPERATELRALPGVRIVELDLLVPFTIDAFVTRARYEKPCVFERVIACAAVLPCDERDPRRQMELALETNAFGTLRLAEGLRPCVAAGVAPAMAFLTEPVRRIEPEWDGATLAYMLSKVVLNARLRDLTAINAVAGVATVALYPGRVRTAIGGETAPLDPAESVAGMMRVLEAPARRPHATMIDHTGRMLEF